MPFASLLLLINFPPPNVINIQKKNPTSQFRNYRIETFPSIFPPTSFSVPPCRTLPEGSLNILVVLPEQTKGQLILSHLQRLAAYRCFRRLFNTVIGATTTQYTPYFHNLLCLRVHQMGTAHITLIFLKKSICDNMEVSGGGKEKISQLSKNRKRCFSLMFGQRLHCKGRTGTTLHSTKL